LIEWYQHGVTPLARQAAAISFMMSRLNGVDITSNSLTFESNSAKPSWCLLVITRYFAPAPAAAFANASAENLVGLNRARSVSYSPIGILALLRIHSP